MTTERESAEVALTAEYVKALKDRVSRLEEALERLIERVGDEARDPSSPIYENMPDE